MGAGSERPRVEPKNPRKQKKRTEEAGSFCFCSYVTQKLPSSQMWRAIRHVASRFSNKQGKENEGKKRPAGLTVDCSGRKPGPCCQSRPHFPISQRPNFPSCFVDIATVDSERVVIMLICISWWVCPALSPHLGIQVGKEALLAPGH